MAHHFVNCLNIFTMNLVFFGDIFVLFHCLSISLLVQCMCKIYQCTLPKLIGIR